MGQEFKEEQEEDTNNKCLSLHCINILTQVHQWRTDACFRMVLQDPQTKVNQIRAVGGD